MSYNSFITPFDWNSLGQDQKEKSAECTFWTGRDGQMSVQYFRPEADVFYQPHTHSEYNLIVCLAGEVVVNQFGQEQTIGPGEALFGNDGVPYSCHYRAAHGGPCESVSISMGRRLMAALTVDFGMPSMDGATAPAFVGKVQGPVLMDCAQGIAQELRGRREAHKIIIETQSIRLLIETLRLWPRSGMVEVEADSSQRLPRREFVRAYEFMRCCRKDSFRMQLLCRFLGSSEERFTRLFLASTQQTPASFYNRLLLDRASDLLSQSSLSIKEISFQLGFKTTSHFIAAFRRLHGIPPQKYREQGNSSPDIGFQMSKLCAV